MLQECRKTSRLPQALLLPVGTHLNNVPYLTDRENGMDRETLPSKQSAVKYVKYQKTINLWTHLRLK